MSERIADAVQGAFFCRLRVVASREEPNTLSILHWWKYYILQVVNFPRSHYCSGICWCIMRITTMMMSEYDFIYSHVHSSVLALHRCMYINCIDLQASMSMINNWGANKPSITCMMWTANANRVARSRVR